MSMNPVVFEAIALRKALIGTYNRQQMVLAPHILYTRHGELYIDAVALERDGQPPKEVKLGTFKLDGLKDLAMEGRSFDRQPVFDPRHERYVGETLFAIEEMQPAG
ncbi:MAG: hypothetical protein PGN09_13955 [Sphingomonas fennica]